MLVSWPSLTEEITKCQKCRLCAARTRAVPGEGNPHARLMFIGEGPGRDEDLTGRPFVGRAGQLLDKMIAAIGLSREEVYIANVVKCRPPQNRDPEEEEVAACREWLRTQIELIDPKIIVCLGRVAAIRFIDPNFKVTKEHGNFIEKDGRLVMGTFHPAALLRNPRNKPDAMEDFFALQSKIKEICPETYSACRKTSFSAKLT